MTHTLQGFGSAYIIIKRYMIMKKIFPLFAVIIVLVLAVCSFHIIPTGYTGVKTSFGQIQETTIQSGKLNFCIPFVQSIHKVNNKQQDKHIEAQVWGEASDKTRLCQFYMKFMEDYDYGSYKENRDRWQGSHL